MMKTYTRLSSLPPELLVAGIDEVGVGPLAGPMVACTVIFRAGHTPIPGVTDSKTLSPAKITNLREEILDECEDFGFGWVSSEEIDKMGHGDARREVLARSFQDLSEVPGHIYLDGTMHVPAISHAEKLAKADSLIWIVGAASILAKFEQVFWMETVAHENWPLYGFDQHRGYGTALHHAALERYGACPAHRRSVKTIKKLQPQRRRSRWSP